MEQSEQPVQSDTQAGVGENSPAVLPSLPPPDFTTVDNNLTGIGFFTASSKRSRRATKKTTVIKDQGVHREISILPSAEYGLPITQDQDYWLALMKLVRDHIQREGILINPFTFTYAELRHILGQSNAGKNYLAMQEWADVMSFTGIKGGAYNSPKKKWIVDRTHVVERFVTLGKELPDGTIADKNHIWFSQWQLDNINSGHLMAIELNTYRLLQNNIAKNLVPHLQEWLFASQGDGRFEKQYDDVCHLLGIRAYQYISDVHRKFGPSLDELVEYGYIAKWSIEMMADKKHYKLVVWHGSKYHRDRQARIEKKHNAQRAGLTAEENPIRRPRQRRLNLQPVSTPDVSAPSPVPVVIDFAIVAQLTKRGISDMDAREIIRSLPPGQPIVDQLEWGDLQITQSRGKITNPPGFYISLLKRGVLPPPTFETSRIRETRLKAELERQQAEQKEHDAEIAAQAEAEGLLDYLRESDPVHYQSLYDQAREELTIAHPGIAVFLKSHPGSSMHDGAIRARIKMLLAQEPPAVHVQNQGLFGSTDVQEPQASKGEKTSSSKSSKTEAPISPLDEPTFAAMLNRVVKTPKLTGRKRTN